jgi:hypothetical protein
VVDIETYGIHDGCPVWAAVFYFFNYKDDKKFVVAVDYDLRFQEKTLHMQSDYAWWDKIDPDFTKRSSIRDALRDADAFIKVDRGEWNDHVSDIKQLLNVVLEDPNAACIWGNGTDFDKVHLEQLYGKLSSVMPWHFRSWLDVPTVVALAKLKVGVDFKKEYKNKVRHATHNPILDCQDEIVYIKQSMTALGVL